MADFTPIRVEAEVISTKKQHQHRDVSQICFTVLLWLFAVWFVAATFVTISMFRYSESPGDVNFSSDESEGSTFQRILRRFSDLEQQVASQKRDIDQLSQDIIRLNDK